VIAPSIIESEKGMYGPAEWTPTAGEMEPGLLGPGFPADQSCSVRSDAKVRTKEASLLVHPSGRAQVDFGQSIGIHRRCAHVRNSF